MNNKLTNTTIQFINIWWRWLLAIIITLLILQNRLWFGSTGLLSLNKIETEIHQLSEQNRQLIYQNQKLQQQIRILKDYPQAKEGYAREYFGYIKRGEQFIRFEKHP